MPGITEPMLSSHPQHQASISPSPLVSPELDLDLQTTSNNEPSELLGELTSTYHQTPPPTPPTTLPTALPNPRDSLTLNAMQSRARTIQIRNRRLHYLTVNRTNYFDNPALELANPLLYDKCIRSFQTPSEREAEGKAKGWSGILHADLERAEARMEALKKATEERRNGEEEEDEDDKVGSKEEGIERWEDVMTRRFLEGGDEDVDYKTIDDNEEYDDVKQIERDVQEAYFDAETPSAPDEGSPCTDTGIQDF